MKKRYNGKEKVLLVNITRLGDMLQATPTIIGIKQENPNAKITVLVEKQFEAVCHSIPEIDDVVAVDLAFVVRSIARGGDGIVDAYEYVDNIVKELKAENFDYCLNMSSSAYTAILIKLIGIDRKGGWASDSEGYRVIESPWARLFASSVFHQNRKFSSFNLVDVFRCVGDVEKHPNTLRVQVTKEATENAKNFIKNCNFTNTGKLLVVQAGASQAKRQWAPKNFIKCIKELIENHNIRVILSGSSKELPIINEIKEGCNSENVAISAGKTSIAELAGLLKEADLLLTGDTGPMHMSIAVGTPVVAMFLASAFGFETGPYSEGNIILQPKIGCYPCNPNKCCSKPDCHFDIDPMDLSKIVLKRLDGDFTEITDDFSLHSNMTIYRSYFDEFGFCDLKALNGNEDKFLHAMREAYRKTWLDDLGGYGVGNEDENQKIPCKIIETSSLKNIPWKNTIDELKKLAGKGLVTIAKVEEVAKNKNRTRQELDNLISDISELDRKIEQLGYDNPPLGMLCRMFVFGKENISGSEVLSLASQTREIYEDLKRRACKLEENYLSSI